MGHIGTSITLYGGLSNQSGIVISLDGGPSRRYKSNTALGWQRDQLLYVATNLTKTNHTLIIQHDPDDVYETLAISWLKVYYNASDTSSQG